MRWPYPFFPLLFIVFGSHKSRWKLQASRIHAANNQGDHMLLSRGKIYGLSSLCFLFATGESEDGRDSGKFRLRFFCACHEGNLHLHLRFPPFSLSSHPLRGKLKYFPALSYRFFALSFRHLSEWKKFFMNYCVHSELISFLLS